MDIITGYTGKAHVTAEQDRDINQGIIGSGSYVLQTGMEMEAEVSSNNEIKIRDGVLIHQGCAASIKKNTYDSLTIINGSHGMNRIDLIVARYSRNKDSGVESLKLMVIQGTPTSGTATVPTYTKGDIQAGDYVADMPMYQVILSGLNITEVKKVFETAPNLTELNSNNIVKSGSIATALGTVYWNKQLNVVTISAQLYKPGGTDNGAVMLCKLPYAPKNETFFGAGTTGTNAGNTYAKITTSGELVVSKGGNSANYMIFGGAYMC